MDLKDKIGIITREKFGDPLKIINITAEGPDAKRGSFYIKLKNKEIKAIVFSDDEELKNFLKLCPLIKEVPKILYYKDNIVFVEWIKGDVLKDNQISKKDIIKIAKLQAKIHKVKVKFNKKEIIENFKNRLKKQIDFLEKNSNLNERELLQIRNIIKNGFPEDPKISIIHNDFNLDNLVRTKSGWLSIDNELLSIGLTGFDFGKPIFNFLKSVGKIKLYLDSYNNVLNVSFYRDNSKFYNLAYLIKQLYSKIRNEKSGIERVYHLISEELK